MKQHSPTLFWLLLAATVAVDAVAIVWLLQNQRALRVGVLYDALCFGQLSVVCIWVVFGRKRWIWNAVVLGIGMLIATAATARLFEFQIPEMIAFFGAYATLLVVSLWIVKHTKLWHHRIEVSPPVWQFSVGQLLVLMTIVAVLLGLFRGSELWGIGESVAIELVLTSLAASALVVVWAKPWRLTIRLACACGIAALFGAISWGYDWWRADPLRDNPAMCVVDALIQAMVIFLWLEVGQIIPGAESTCDSLPPKS